MREPSAISHGVHWAIYVIVWYINAIILSPYVALLIFQCYMIIKWNYSHFKLWTSHNQWPAHTHGDSWTQLRFLWSLNTEIHKTTNRITLKLDKDDGVCIHLSWIPFLPDRAELDKEAGGLHLLDLCTITYRIVYPDASSANFEICITCSSQHQPPSPKALQTATWRHRYIEYWTSKTKGSPIGFITILEVCKAEQLP